MSLRMELLVLLLLSMAGVTSAQDTAPLLTLEEAIRLAEENNHQLRIAGAQLDAAEAGLDEAQSHRLPRLDLEGGYQRTDNPVLVLATCCARRASGPRTSKSRASIVPIRSTIGICGSPSTTPCGRADASATAKLLPDCTATPPAHARNVYGRRSCDRSSNASPQRCWPSASSKWPANPWRPPRLTYA